MKKPEIKTVKKPKEGIRTHFHALDEAHLDELAKDPHIGTRQEALRELVRRDRIAKQQQKKP